MKKLPKMSNEELKILRKGIVELNGKIDFLLRDVELDSSQIYQELLYDAIITKLYDVNKMPKTPFGIFKKRTQTYKKLIEVKKYLNEYLFELRKTVVDRDHAQRLYHLFAKLLIEDMKKGNIPISIVTVLNCHDRFPGLLSKAFPDYIENNLVNAIFEIGVL